MRSASESASAIGLSLVAYSSAALVSCTEQGPTTTRNLASLPSRIASIARRASYTLVDAISLRGISSASMAGESSGRVLTMRKSSVFIAGSQPERAQEFSKQPRVTVHSKTPQAAKRIDSTTIPHFGERILDYGKLCYPYGKSLKKL